MRYQLSMQQRSKEWLSRRHFFAVQVGVRVVAEPTQKFDDGGRIVGEIAADCAVLHGSAQAKRAEGDYGDNEVGGRPRT
jgi:hypothetical protein